MLTADLVRATLRKDSVKPTFLRGKNDRARVWAAQLIDLFERSVGGPREDLELEMAEIIGDAPDFLLARGFAKLLDDRSDWSTELKVNPEELRGALFDAAFARVGGDASTSPPGAKRRRAREEVISEVAARFEISAEEVEHAMYADFRSQEILRGFNTLSVDDLLVRYDVALVQAVLLRATELELTVQKATPGQLRGLFRALKFHQLLFEAERLDDGSWGIQIDGPLNILQRSGRYGLQLAQMVPPILHFAKWSMRATLRWPSREEPVMMQLSHLDKLIPPAKLPGAWVSAEQELLVQRIRDAAGPWEVVEDVEIIDLGGRDVLVPEIILRHKDGRSAFVEVVGTWRKAWLEKKLERLREFGPPNLVLCVSKNLAAYHGEDDALGSEFVVFSQVIPMAKVLAMAEKVAR